MRSAREARHTLEQILSDAIAAVSPERVLARVIERDGAALRIAGEPVPDTARLRVLAAGKAAAGMVAALEARAGDRIAGGLVVTKDGHGLPLARLPLRESGHPVPDVRSAAAGRELLQVASQGDSDEIVVVLLSGGASALLATPLAGLTGEEIAATTTALLGSGAAIEELNCVRKHLCDVTGGRLARSIGGRRTYLLAISDVVGDRLDVIGSGPCTPDPTTFALALDVLRTRRIDSDVPRAIRAFLEAGARGDVVESPKAGDPCFAAVTTAVVASNADAVRAASEAAATRRLQPLSLGSAVIGEAREVGRHLASLALACTPVRDLLLVAGGETTVTLRGTGKGGRNQELALSAAIALEGRAGITLLAAGTDGTDGPTDAAGACVDGETLSRGRARGLDARHACAQNDAYTFFSVEEGLVRTGPTGTNVMDLALVAIGAGGSGR